MSWNYGHDEGEERCSTPSPTTSSRPQSSTTKCIALNWILRSTSTTQQHTQLRKENENVKHPTRRNTTDEQEQDEVDHIASISKPRSRAVHISRVLNTLHLLLLHLLILDLPTTSPLFGSPIDTTTAGEMANPIPSYNSRRIPPPVAKTTPASKRSQRPVFRNHAPPDCNGS